MGFLRRLPWIMARTWIVMLLAAACGTPQTESTMAEPKVVALEVLRPGVHELTIRREDGIDVNFTLSVPATYSEQAPSPLIVALHYGGEVTPFFGRAVLEELFLPALGELDAVMVAPDSVAGSWTNEVNEEAVMQVVESILASYNVDRQKTLLTGYSMGGIGTWYLAPRNQETFAAALPVSGRPIGDPQCAVPFYVIHSQDDQVFSAQPTMEHVEQLKENDCDAQLIVVQGLTHYEVPRFADPLREAIPWIEEVWGKRSG